MSTPKPHQMIVASPWLPIRFNPQKIAFVLFVGLATLGAGQVFMGLAGQEHNVKEYHQQLCQKNSAPAYKPSQDQGKNLRSTPPLAKFFQTCSTTRQFLYDHPLLATVIGVAATLLIYRIY
ncbi:MAG: hypothetical protein ACPGC9_01580, partial [Cytophagales bacterium]